MVLWAGGLIKERFWRFELLTVLFEGASILEGCAAATAAALCFDIARDSKLSKCLLSLETACAGMLSAEPEPVNVDNLGWESTP